jgi:hypothetical protein
LREIFTSIEAVDNFVFVISPEPLASDHCRKEIDHGVANDKRMVPICIDPCPTKRFPKRRADERSAQDDESIGVPGAALKRRTAREPALRETAIRFSAEARVRP